MYCIKIWLKYVNRGSYMTQVQSEVMLLGACASLGGYCRGDFQNLYSPFPTYLSISMCFLHNLVRFVL